MTRAKIELRRRSAVANSRANIRSHIMHAMQEQGHLDNRIRDMKLCQSRRNVAIASITRSLKFL